MEREPSYKILPGPHAPPLARLAPRWDPTGVRHVRPEASRCGRLRAVWCAPAAARPTKWPTRHNQDVGKSRAAGKLPEKRNCDRRDRGKGHRVGSSPRRERPKGRNGVPEVQEFPQNLQPAQVPVHSPDVERILARQAADVPKYRASGGQARSFDSAGPATEAVPGRGGAKGPRMGCSAKGAMTGSQGKPAGSTRRSSPPTSYTNPMPPPSVEYLP